MIASGPISLKRESSSGQRDHDPLVKAWNVSAVRRLLVYHAAPQLRFSAMTEPMIITVSHSIGKEEAVSRLKNGLARVTSGLPMLKLEDEVWTGDRLDFRLSAMGAQAFGNVEVGEKDVRIEITLPWLLQRFAEAIQGTIKEKSQVLLEK